MLWRGALEGQETTGGENGAEQWSGKENNDDRGAEGEIRGRQRARRVLLARFCSLSVLGGAGLFVYQKLF